MCIKEGKSIFCQNIHQRRLDCGLSLQKLAKQSGVALEMLEELERDMIPEEMMVDDAIALAQVFGCEPYELFQKKRDGCPSR